MKTGLSGRQALRECALGQELEATNAAGTRVRVNRHGTPQRFNVLRQRWVIAPKAFAEKMGPYWVSGAVKRETPEEPKLDPLDAHITEGRARAIAVAAVQQMHGEVQAACEKRIAETNGPAVRIIAVTAVRDFLITARLSLLKD